MSEEIRATVKRLATLYGSYEALAREIGVSWVTVQGGLADGHVLRPWRHDVFRNSSTTKISPTHSCFWESLSERNGS